MFRPKSGQLPQLCVPFLHQLVGQRLQLRAAGQKQDESQEQGHDLCLFHIGTPSNSQKSALAILNFHPLEIQGVDLNGDQIPGLAL